MSSFLTTYSVHLWPQQSTFPVAAEHTKTQRHHLIKWEHHINQRFTVHIESCVRSGKKNLMASLPYANYKLIFSLKENTSFYQNINRAHVSWS